MRKSAKKRSKIPKQIYWDRFMDDTSPEIAEIVCERLQKKTPAERLKMGSSMHATSKLLVTRAILENTPNISEEGLRQELFLKFYGTDFDPDQREKILRHLAQYRSPSYDKDASQGHRYK